MVHVDPSDHPLPGESIGGVQVGDIRTALRQGDMEEALRLTRSLQTTAASGCWQVQEPDGRMYPLLISGGPSMRVADLMHMLRNGVVMQLALAARKDEPLKQRLKEYEAFLHSLADGGPR
ncbi:MAG: hypothetical protein AB1758_00765 [Candidatus Eremiobacterota bacterium]